MIRILSALILALILVGPGRAADTSPTAADVRKAVARALPFVEKDGLAWIEERNCMSCHTVTFMLWAHEEAAAHGIPVDRKKLAGWTKWSWDKSRDTRVFFKLDAKAAESLPEALRDQLGDVIGEGFTRETEFVAALAAALPPDELKRHRPDLVKRAALKPLGAVNDGGGLDTMAQLFLARDRASEREKFGDFFAGTAELIARMQEANGTWKAGGQLPSRKWSKATADQTTTMWTAVALGTLDSPSPTVQKALDAAHAALKKPAGDGNLEWLVARLVYEKRFGTPEQIDGAKKALLKRQNADGGWAVRPDGKSDAFSTGQSLYALRVAGVAHDDPAIRGGQKYLLDTQGKDGSWAVPPALTSNGGPPRLTKLEPIWRNWGTSWATIGLAKSLPPK